MGCGARPRVPLSSAGTAYRCPTGIAASDPADRGLHGPSDQKHFPCLDPRLRRTDPGGTAREQRHLPTPPGILDRLRDLLFSVLASLVSQPPPRGKARKGSETVISACGRRQQPACDFGAATILIVVRNIIESRGRAVELDRLLAYARPRRMLCPA